MVTVTTKIHENIHSIFYRIGENLYNEKDGTVPGRFQYIDNDQRREISRSTKFWQYRGAFIPVFPIDVQDNYMRMFTPTEQLVREGRIHYIYVKKVNDRE